MTSCHNNEISEGQWQARPMHSKFFCHHWILVCVFVCERVIKSRYYKIDVWQEHTRWTSLYFLQTLWHYYQQTWLPPERWRWIYHHLQHYYWGVAQWLERRTHDRKGRGFESLLERWENSILQGWLSVLTLISVSVPPPCYRSST